MRFVISATSIDKRRSAWKRLSKLASIETFDKPDTSKAGWEEAVLAEANRKARAMGITFESGALELLVQMAGDDTRQMENELEKIDLYLGERRRAGLATVRNLVSMSRAGVIWEIGNAIAARDLQRALERLGTLMHQGQNPVGLLLAAIGGVAITVDIPLIRLADGNPGTILLLRSATTLVATLAIVAILATSSVALVSTGIGRSLSVLEPIVRRVRGDRRAFAALPEGPEVPSEVRPLVHAVNGLLRELSQEHAARTGLPPSAEG